jgi:hypothetical protein
MGKGTGRCRAVHRPIHNVPHEVLATVDVVFDAADLDVA